MKIFFKLIKLLFLAIFFISIPTIYYIRYLKNVVYYTGKPVEYFNGKEFARISYEEQPFLGNWQEEAEIREKMRSIFFKRMLFGEEKQKPEDIVEVLKSKPNANSPTDIIRTYYINHSTFLIQASGLNIITDPIYSNKAGPYNLVGTKRLHKPGIDLNDLPNIDIVIISHGHFDHLDLWTVKQIFKKNNPLFIVPAGVGYLIKSVHKNIRYIELLWNEETVFKNIKFTLTPAYHWYKRGLFDDNKALWGGFIIQTQNSNIYFSGDTAYGDGKVFKEIGEKYKTIDLALLPIGAYLPNSFMRRSHTNPLEAVKIFKLINAKKAIAMHTGTFTLSLDTISIATKDLKEAKEELTVEDFNVLKPGQYLDILDKK